MANIDDSTFDIQERKRKILGLEVDYDALILSILSEFGYNIYSDCLVSVNNRKMIFEEPHDSIRQEIVDFRHLQREPAIAEEIKFIVQDITVKCTQEK